MQKLLLRGFSVLLLIAVLYTILIFIMTYAGLNRWIPNAKNTAGRGYYTYSRLQELENVKNVDILFTGSSHVYRAIDTRIFEKAGIKAFNLGTSGQTPLNTYYLLKEHLKQLNPKVVVLDLYIEGLDGNGSSAAVEIASNHKFTENILEMATMGIDLQTLSSLYAIQVSRFHTTLSEVKEMQLDDDKYIPGGYIESTNIINELKPEHLKKLPKRETGISELQQEYINKTIELCKQNNIQILLTVLPVTKEFRSSIVNYDACVNELNRLASAKSVKIIDYDADEQELSSINDFLDANHLNPNGAVKISYKIMKDLKIMRYLK